VKRGGNATVWEGKDNDPMEGPGKERPFFTELSPSTSPELGGFFSGGSEKKRGGRGKE